MFVRNGTDTDAQSGSAVRSAGVLLETAPTDLNQCHLFRSALI
jgi:hypothetical protein